LIGAFSANLARFHAADGSGYRWLADRILQVKLKSHTLRLAVQAAMGQSSDKLSSYILTRAGRQDQPAKRCSADRCLFHFPSL
jgi:hypothetical protein